MNRDLPEGRGGMRIPVLLLALLCLATGALAGWRLRGAPPAPPSYLAQLTEMLELRPDQVAALDSVLAAEDRELDALLRDQLGRLHEPVAARRERTEQELLALLDAPQRQRYEQLLAAGGGSGGR